MLLYRRNGPVRSLPMDKPDRVEEPDSSDEHDLRFWIWFAAMVAGTPFLLWYERPHRRRRTRPVFSRLLPAVAPCGRQMASARRRPLRLESAGSDSLACSWLAREQFRLHRERRATRSGGSAGSR